MPMGNSQFYDFVQAMMLKCIEVMRTKGEEYTEGSDNKLANFEEEALETNVPVLDIIHIFANKHQRAINNFRKTGRVESEALEMRFVDQINYLFLELAECIALGYDPREEWLIEALGNPLVSEVEVTSKVPPAESAESMEDESCCGFHGHKDCCQEAHAPGEKPPAPTQERKARRRPPRPRIPNTKADEDIPLALPDRRLDPEAIAERAKAKKQRDE